MATDLRAPMIRSLLQQQQWAAVRALPADQPVHRITDLLLRGSSQILAREVEAGSDQWSVRDA